MQDSLESKLDEESLRQYRLLLLEARIDVLNFVLSGASGGGNWRRVIIAEISRLTTQRAKLMKGKV